MSYERFFSSRKKDVGSGAVLCMWQNLVELGSKFDFNFSLKKHTHRHTDTKKKKEKKHQEHYLKHNCVLEFYLSDEMPTTKRTLKIKQESSEDTQ